MSVTMLIYKIFRDNEWATMQAQGETTGAPIDVADGYVHFSTADTLRKTAELYFTDVHNLWLLAVDAEPLGDDLVWEESRGGVKFPHLYRVLRMDDVLWYKPLPIGAQGHEFPKEIP